MKYSEKLRNGGGHGIHGDMCVCVCSKLLCSGEVSPPCPSAQHIQLLTSPGSGGMTSPLSATNSLPLQEEGERRKTREAVRWITRGGRGRLETVLHFLHYKGVLH